MKKLNLILTVIAVMVMTLVSCPSMEETGNANGTNNSDEKNGDVNDATIDTISIQNNSISLGQRDETVDGVVYIVKSYAEVHAECPYYYEYYRLYYLNGILRKAVFVPHGLTHGYATLDYTYTEINTDENYLKSDGCFIYVYSDKGYITEYRMYEEGHLYSSTAYYESGNEKMFIDKASIRFYFDNINRGRKNTSLL